MKRAIQAARSKRQPAIRRSIARFFGIVIKMYYNDHGPPHFHAYYGDFEISVRIDTGSVEGPFLGRARSLVIEWYTLHQEVLMTNWQRSRERRALLPIRPLE